MNDTTKNFSPAGYPLVYAIDGSGNRMPNPRVLYDSQTFASDQEIATYKAALAQSMANRMREQGEMQTAAGILQPGQIDIRSLNADDLRYFNRYSQELNNVVGPLNIVHEFINWFAYGSAPLETIPATSDLLDTRTTHFDFNAYTGPLKAYMPK